MNKIERDVYLYAETTNLFNYALERLENWYIHIGKSQLEVRPDDYKLLDEIAYFPVTERDMRLNPDDTLSLILRGEWVADADYWLYEWGLSLELKCDDGVKRRFLMVRDVTLGYRVITGERLRVGWIITY